MTVADADRVFASMREHLAPGTALAAKLAGRGAVEVEASGATVRLSDGREMVDLGSYAVTLLGHRPAAVVEAVHRQLDTMPTATRVLGNPAVAGLAADLAARFAPLQRVWFGSGGADVVELAAKLARRASGRPRLLAVAGGFHGKTLGALSLTWNPAFRRDLERFLGPVTHINPGDPDAVRRQVERGDVAALFFEPVQGEAGVRPLDPETLRRWTADARTAGVFTVADEIQAGLHRAGPLSPSLAAGLRPDALLLGKALGGGVMPLSALAASEDLYAPLTADPTWHSSTFGGHPLACAAGRAALPEIERRAPDADAVGAQLAAGLRRLAADHPDVVAEVRGSGLMWAVEMHSPAMAGGALFGLGQRGILVSPCLGSQETIRLLPPMVASRAEIDLALEAFAAALTDAREASGAGQRVQAPPAVA